MLLIQAVTISAYRARDPMPAVLTDVLESGDVLPPSNKTVDARARPRCREKSLFGHSTVEVKVRKNACLPAAKCKLYDFYILFK